MGRSGAPEGTAPSREPVFADAVHRPETDAAILETAASGQGRQRGSNSAAFRDPMTLEQVFPGLRSAPGGSIVALADGIFDLGGPAQAATSAWAKNITSDLIAQIRAIDPSYRFESLGFPQTMAGQISQINELKLVRAVTLLRFKGEVRPLQTETVRLMQGEASRAYAIGVQLLRSGRLKQHISEGLTLGNYVDQSVRTALRWHFRRIGAKSAGPGIVRVNRREYARGENELTFRRPDAPVGGVAFDVTLTAKTAKTHQIRDFFGADFAPTQVVIIRPSQLGPHSSYAINRPEIRR